MFTDNSSLIHLQITKEVVMCNKRVLVINFKDVYLVEMRNQQPITKQLPCSDLGILKEFSIQDLLIFDKMAQLLKTNIEGLAKNHCLDNTISTVQWNMLIARARSNRLQPFSVDPESNKFYLPYGETNYSFRCKKKNC